MAQRGATNRATEKRASVVECVRPSGAVAQRDCCQRAGQWIFPRRDYWRTSHGSRKDTARANEPWWRGLAGGDVCQSGGGPPYSTTLARDPQAPFVALLLGVRPVLGRRDVILSQPSPNRTLHSERQHYHLPPDGSTAAPPAWLNAARPTGRPRNAPASWSAPGPPALWPSATIVNERVSGFSLGAIIGERLTAPAKRRHERTNHGGVG